jgi:hypothetical protein
LSFSLSPSGERAGERGSLFLEILMTTRDRLPLSLTLSPEGERGQEGVIKCNL